MSNKTPIVFNLDEKRLEQIQDTDTLFVPNDLEVYSSFRCASGYEISDSGDINAYNQRFTSFSDNTHYDGQTNESRVCVSFYHRQLFSHDDGTYPIVNWASNHSLSTKIVDDSDSLNHGFYSRTDFSSGDTTGRGFFPVTAQSSGVLSISVVDPASNGGCCAYLYLSTGTSAVGAAHARGNDSIYLNNAAAEFEWGARVTVSDVSTSSDEYHIQIGLQSPTATTTGLTSHNHIIFHNDRATYGDVNWRAITRLSANTSTVTDTGVAASTSWQRLYWKLDRNNSAARVRFYIDKSLVATHTTNIPESVTNLHERAACIKTVGTTARSLRIDYVFHKMIFLTRQTRF